MDNKGRHVIADIYLTEPVSDAVLSELCEEAINQSKMNIVLSAEKLFEPKGLTKVWVLSESHFTIHTYPEHDYLSVDCYTCGMEGDPQAAIDHLIASLPVKEVKTQALTRG